MFTASFLYGLLQMAIPALTSILSIGLSKYLERKDKPELAMLVRLASLAGLFSFFLVPQLDKLFDNLANTLDLESLTGIAPAHAPELAPLPNAHTAAIYTPPQDTHSYIPSHTTAQDVTQVKLPAPEGKFHIDLPYLDYKPAIKPMDLTPLHIEINTWTKRLLQDTTGTPIEIPPIDMSPLHHLSGFAKNGWEIFKDIVLR